MDKRYSFNIEWSEEDQEYIATCPAFSGLTAFGETEEEALSEAKIALQGFIETCKEQNIPLPEPQLRETYSGQFRVRLPKTLHRQAAQFAAADGISLNQLVISAVEGRVGAKQVGERMLAEVKRALSEHSTQLKVVIATALTANDRVTTEETISESSSTRTQRVVYGKFGKSN
jgi:predicted RNase H-like HicB family nuclease/RNA-binding protein YhbY